MNIIKNKKASDLQEINATEKDRDSNIVELFNPANETGLVKKRGASFITGSHDVLRSIKAEILMSRSNIGMSLCKMDTGYEPGSIGYIPSKKGYIENNVGSVHFPQLIHTFYNPNQEDVKDLGILFNDHISLSCMTLNLFGGIDFLLVEIERQFNKLSRKEITQLVDDICLAPYLFGTPIIVLWEDGDDGKTLIERLNFSSIDESFGKFRCYGIKGENLLYDQRQNVALQSLHSRFYASEGKIRRAES